MDYLAKHIVALRIEGKRREFAPGAPIPSGLLTERDAAELEALGAIHKSSVESAAEDADPIPAGGEIAGTNTSGAETAPADVSAAWAAGDAAAPDAHASSARANVVAAGSLPPEGETSGDGSGEALPDIDPAAYPADAAALDGEQTKPGRKARAKKE